MIIKGDFRGKDADHLDVIGCSPGWHLSELERVAEDPKDGKLLTTWKILSEPCVGSRVDDNYSNPWLCEDETKFKGLLDRLNMWLCRVGLVKREDAGKDPEYDTSKAIGVKRVISVVIDDWAPPGGTPMRKPKIDFVKIFETNRPEIPVADRIRLGLPLLPGQVAPSAGQTAPSPASKQGKVAPPGGLAFDASELDPSNV